MRLVSRERWHALQPLLDTALELDPPQRAAYLDEACGSDVALRTEVGEMLASCERAEAMMETPAALAYAPLLTEPTTALPTQLDGRYDIVREIGRGGMATVYLADDPKHSRQVAVKVLHSRVARLVGRERFLREIEIAAGLSHPHILPLHDSGAVPSDRADEPAFLYFVSPFIAGETLRDRLIRESKLSIDVATRLTREIAEALDYAHRSGVIHLDIKPENILLLEGHAIVADFGIARAIRSGNDDDRSPALGTPSYMSPEQGAGTGDVDARSDVYSLGRMLHEMVTGERPRGDRTTDALDDALDRTGTPRELAAIIRRATERDRDERFHTAGELARALGGLVAPRPARSRLVEMCTHSSLRVRLGALAAAIAVTLVALLLVRRDAPTLDPDLVAVAPFDVQTPGLALWSEGMVDVMSRNLDGAGALRAVPASVVIQRWQGRGDAASAQALGERTHARLVLFGGLLAAGDSVRATAVLFDAHTGRSVAEFEARDVPNRVDRLADSLTVAVLRQIGASRHTDLARAASSPTASLGALKSYLQGEQFYRAARWDSAQTHFEQAIALDSTFALAYHRLAAVRRWRDPSAMPDSVTYAMMRLTSRYAHGLGPREKLLARIDSLSAGVYATWYAGFVDPKRYGALEALIKELHHTLIDGERRYPYDAELVFLCADARWRFDPQYLMGEVDDRGILALFDRAIALDSSFAPAYVTPITLSAFLNGPASARRYIRAYLTRAPSGPDAPTIRLADALLDPIRGPQLDITRLVDTLSSDGLCQATSLLRHVPDSADMIVRIARTIATRSDPASLEGPTCGLMAAVDGLQFRGHLRDAERISGHAHWSRPEVLFNLSRFGMVSNDTARAAFHRVLAFAPMTTIPRLYGWWAKDGDTVSIQAYIRAFQHNAVDLRSTSGAAMMRSSIAAGNAYLALARRDTASTLRQLTTTADTLHECWYQQRMTIVQLLIAAGRDADAATYLQRRWPGTSECSDGVDDVLWTMYRARVFERTGRKALAAANYAFVADAWRTADPELQSYVRESHTALARLAQAHIVPLVAR